MSQPRITFIIPCHNIEEDGYIIRCIESIRRTNPKADVIVVDSDSPNRSYINKIDAEVLDIHNRNYAWGAYWQGYRHKRGSDLYVCIHDSTVVNYEVKVEEWSEYLATPLSWFRENRNPTYEEIRLGCVEHTKRTIGISDEMAEGCQCVFAAAFMAKDEFFSKLLESGFHKWYPESKWPAVYADEYLWALGMEAVGVPVVHAARYGQADSLTDPSRIITKYSGCIEKGRM